jgi:predicted nucleic acid-binding protein
LLYLADTSAWWRSRANESIALRWARLLAEHDLAVCVPLQLELLYSARGPADYSVLQEELDALVRLPATPDAEAEALKTQQALAAKSQHRGPKPMDVLIAVIAKVHGAVLLHYDRHFDVIARVTRQQAEWLAPRGSLD